MDLTCSGKNNLKTSIKCVLLFRYYNIINFRNNRPNVILKVRQTINIIYNLKLKFK